MKLQKQKGLTCLITSAAMVLDVDVKQLIVDVGHDGSEIFFPNCIYENYRQRLHHPQELIEPCLKYGYVFMTVDTIPAAHANNDSSIVKQLYSLTESEKRFKRFIKDRKAILITDNHAIAWDGSKVYDPRGIITESLNDYLINMAFIFFKIN